MEKIVRTITYFTDNLGSYPLIEIDKLKKRLNDIGYTVQTTRIVSSEKSILELDKTFTHNDVLTSIGEVKNVDSNLLDEFLLTKKTSFNYDLSNKDITLEDVDFLFKIIESNAKKTFNFAYTFTNAHSSPFFPSAKFEKNGFAIGLQSTDLVEDCSGLDEWFERQKACWIEIYEEFKNDKDFIGIDSSVAPLMSGKSSLINMIKMIHGDFTSSILSDTYLKITKFIKTQNPKPTGLCGLMIPCLEDFELADEYENGNFDLKTNLFLSLHSGLGIDTYPIGINENREKVLSLLKLVQGLSKKYLKPLSIRFVSDGSAKIGDVTNFENEYLKDVKVRPI